MLNFISEHHVLSLATSHNNKPSSCSVFYAFMQDDKAFVFASEHKSEHIQNIIQNSNVSAGIHDETRDVMLIRGLQVKGEVKKAEARHEELYLEIFPEAAEIKKEIWMIKISELKFTDNKEIGFGKKEVWKS